MTTTKLFLIWLGVFCLSLAIGWVLRKTAPKIGHIQRSFITSLVLVPAIIFGVIPLADSISSLF